MEEFLNILNQLKVPGALLLIITMIIKLKPVSFLTSNDLERKLSSKEFRFSYSIVTYLLQTLLYTLFVVVLADLINGLIAEYSLFHDIIFFLIELVLVVIFSIFYMKYEKGKKFNPDPEKWYKTLGFLLLILLYLLGWLCSISYILSRSVYHDFSPKNDLTNELWIALVVAAYILCLMLPLLFKPILKYVEIQSKRDYYIEDDEKQKWYILHPINSEEILLGDKVNSTSSKQYKIIPKDNLIGILIKGEENKGV